VKRLALMFSNPSFMFFCTPAKVPGGLYLSFPQRSGHKTAGQIRLPFSHRVLVKLHFLFGGPVEPFFGLCEGFLSVLQRLRSTGSYKVKIEEALLLASLQKSRELVLVFTSKLSVAQRLEMGGIGLVHVVVSQSDLWVSRWSFNKNWD